MSAVDAARRRLVLFCIVVLAAVTTCGENADDDLERFGIGNIGVVVDADVGSPFNDAAIKEPTTNVGPPITEAELWLAAKTPVAVPARGELPPIDVVASLRNYFTYTVYRWPNGRVPYTIDAAFTSKERVIITQAIQEIMSKSCIVFTEKTGSDQDFVHIYTDDSPGCYANDHYTKGLGQHGIHLARPGCMYRHVIVHEFMHLLGVGHEHQRPDRDQYVGINWENIKSGVAYNFFKDTWDNDTEPPNLCYKWRDYDDPSGFADCSSGLVRKDYGYGYDYYSVMHYMSNFFATESSLKTIVPKDPSVKEFGGLVMTEGDELKLRAAYGCGGCGGSKTGEKGHIKLRAGDGPPGCEWLLTVADGDVIELKFEQFQFPDCSSGSLTLYEGYKQLGEKRSVYCGDNQPPKVLTSFTNQVTIAVSVSDSRYGGANRLSLKWRRRRVDCCQTLELARADPYRPSPYLDPYLGTYRRAGTVHGTYYYRHQARINTWFGRFEPMSKYTKYSWVAVDDAFGLPGYRPDSRRAVYFGGNVKCPTFAWSGFFHDGRLDQKDIAEFKIRCKDERIIRS